jgi:hypothetical protein
MTETISIPKLDELHILELDLDFELQAVDLFQSIVDTDLEDLFDFARTVLADPSIATFYKSIFMHAFYMLHMKFGLLHKKPTRPDIFNARSTYFRNQLVQILHKHISFVISSTRVEA